MRKIKECLRFFVRAEPDGVYLLEEMSRLGGIYFWNGTFPMRFPCPRNASFSTPGRKPR
jgi:hypothetical protein